MQYANYDLGYQTTGSLVQVTLSGHAANVKLLDQSNFQAYKRGAQHRGHGGYFTSSPIRLEVPHDGHWHVTIDLGGGRGSVRSSVKVLRRAA